MERNKHIDHEVEKTLNVLKEAEVPEPNPFLYTRLMNEIEKRKTGRTSSKLNISFAYGVAMALLIVLNTFSLIYYIDTDTNVTGNRKEYISELVDEYAINYKSEF